MLCEIPKKKIFQNNCLISIQIGSYWTLYEISNSLGASEEDEDKNEFTTMFISNRYTYKLMDGMYFHCMFTVYSKSYFFSH